MTQPRDIDDAIDGLDEALRAAGLPGVEPPADVTPIAAIVEHVAPYVLPAELRRFWERVDADRIAVFTFPMLRGPAHTLEILSWLRESEAPLPIGFPPLLLPVDYASQCYCVIELGSEWSDGGVILEWEMDAHSLVAHSLADRIDLLGELLAAGHFERMGDGSDGEVSIDHRVEQELRIAHLDASGPHPLYGDQRALPTDLTSWPAHWLTASGVDLRDRRPVGATHSVAGLVAAATNGRVTGRIHGEVIRLAGSGEGALVVVEDGTAAIDVWCPADTSPWGPVHRSRFEFEVTVEGPVGALPELDATHVEITRHALAGDLGSAQKAALALAETLARHRPAAVASDIRPLD